MSKKNWVWRSCHDHSPPNKTLCLFHTFGRVESYFVCTPEDHGLYHKGEEWMALPRKTR